MMLADVQALADFYATGRGRVVARLLRRHLSTLWPDLSGQTLLGLGYTAPFLGLWRHRAAACIDGVTAAASPAPGTTEARAAPVAGCLLHDELLPFPAACLDRVLMVHALETAADGQATLRAALRALRDDGRLLIVVPNRNGLWAHSESTPFAEGAPCSTGRIERMLARALFSVERMEGALYCPPADLRPLLRFGRALEVAGRYVSPRLAGVLVVEAVKDIHAAIPASPIRAPIRAPVRRVLLPLGGAHAARDGAHARNPAGARAAVQLDRSW